MLSPEFIAAQHARSLRETGAQSMFEDDTMPQASPTFGLSIPVPRGHMTASAKFDVLESTRRVFISSVTADLQQLSLVLLFEGQFSGPVNSTVTLPDRTFHYQNLFKPEQSQVAGAFLWGHGGERASQAQDWIVKLLRPAPASKATVVEKFNLLVAEWRQTRNPIGSVLEMCSNFAYQKIIGMGKDAVPLILRELERSLDHWFWALGAITGANPVAEAHRGRLSQMAKDWFAWARQQGYHW